MTVKGRQPPCPAGGKLRYNSPQNFFAYFLFSLLGTFFFTAVTQAQVTYQYDTYSAPYTGAPNGSGRVTSVTDPTGSTTFFYDARGNVTKTIKVIEGNSFTVESTYDSLNRVTTTTYPDTSNPEVVTNTYDAAGNLKTVTSPATSYVTDISYNTFNQRTKITLGNNVSTAYTYDLNSFRLSQICTRLTLDCSDPASTPTTLQKISYGYDAVGNVTTMADGVNATNSQTFTYDDLNRLKTATGPYGNFTNTPYQYDPIGNMTYNPLVGNYTYPQSGIASVRPHAVQTAGGSGNVYSYDDNGNMTSGPSYDASGNLISATARTFTYDMENRPTTIVNNGVQVTMAYDYKGSRVKRMAAGVTTYYIGRIYEKKGNAAIKYIFAGTTRVAMKSSDGSIYFYHSNHLDSTHLMTNTAGTKVEEIRYTPFGGGFALSDSGEINVNHKYTSQEFDSEAGLYYYKARYYDSALGRFTTPDTMKFGISMPQTQNRYSYVLNNPLKYTDPTGHIAQNQTNTNTNTNYNNQNKRDPVHAGTLSQMCGASYCGGERNITIDDSGGISIIGNRNDTTSHLRVRLVTPSIRRGKEGGGNGQQQQRIEVITTEGTIQLDIPEGMDAELMVRSMNNMIQQNDPLGPQYWGYWADQVIDHIIDEIMDKACSRCGPFPELYPNIIDEFNNMIRGGHADAAELPLLNGPGTSTDLDGFRQPVAGSGSDFQTGSPANVDNSF